LPHRRAGLPSLQKQRLRMHQRQGQPRVSFRARMFTHREKNREKSTEFGKLTLSTRDLSFYLPLFGLPFSSSCGGCLVGKGVDCSDLPGVNEVSCRSGHCIVGELYLFPFPSPSSSILPLLFSLLLRDLISPTPNSPLIFSSSLLRLLLPRVDALYRRDLRRSLIKTKKSLRVA